MPSFGFLPTADPKAYVKMRDSVAEKNGDPQAAGIFAMGRRTADIFLNLLDSGLTYSESHRDMFSDIPDFSLPQPGRELSVCHDVKKNITAVCTDEGKLYMDPRDAWLRSLREKAQKISGEIDALHRAGKRMEFDMTPEGNGERKYNDLIPRVTLQCVYDRGQYPGMVVEHGDGDEEHNLSLMFLKPKGKPGGGALSLTLMLDSRGRKSTLYYDASMEPLIEEAQRRAAGTPDRQDLSYRR